MLIEGEECKFIEGTNEFYAVSVTGKVWSFMKKGNHKNKRGEPHLMRPSKNPYGYLQVELSIGKDYVHFYVHRLVAIAFIPNPLNLPQVNHKNEIKTDNRVENLEWMSCKDNINYGTRNARASESRKGKATRTGKYIHKISNEDIRHLRTVKKLSIQKIADMFNVSFCCIYKRCKSMGIN